MNNPSNKRPPRWSLKKSKKSLVEIEKRINKGCLSLLDSFL